MAFTTITIELLKSLSHIVGNYGLGIILLTVIIRLAMWPLGVSQQRSMKTMQTLQPKIKALQDRYKSDPQVMQKKMMEFYKEHKFNPMSGCFPLLVQMPIFILLYSALMSPQFIQIAGNSQFLFVKRLDATLKTTAGISYDGVMNVSKYDNFYLGKTATVYLPNGEVLENVKVEKPNKALEIQGTVRPGEPIDFKVSLDSLDLKFSQLDKIQKAELTISNAQNKESEKALFARKNGLLVTVMPTKEVKSSFHYDVLLLIILFGLTMVATQKIMMASTKNQPQDPTQQAMQKSMGIFMPIMVTATFVFIPIPAGVLLYLISSNVIQVIQTVVINKQLDVEEAKKAALKKQKVDEDDIKGAKKVEAKQIKDKRLGMLLSEFDYILPEELIAQTPSKERTHSKMLVLDKSAETFEDKHFFDIINLLNKNDVLVLNDTKVIPARLFGQKTTGAKVEIFLLKEISPKIWEALMKPSKRINAGNIIKISDDLTVVAKERLEDGKWIVELAYQGDIYSVLDKVGNIPLPPYIERSLSDEEIKKLDYERYQTVFAHHAGSVAAPTAGLHFSTEILEELKSKGVEICYVTLNVGLGTFRPVKCENILEHKMDTEIFEIPECTANIINNAKESGKRIIAVGTTSVRTLETAFQKHGCIKACKDSSQLFIYPPYEFKVVDKLITNFHLPKSTLLMLVSALAGKEFIKKAYEHAIETKYRFYSYGDCMFIA